MITKREAEKLTDHAYALYCIAEVMSRPWTDETLDMIANLAEGVGYPRLTEGDLTAVDWHWASAPVWNEVRRALNMVEDGFTH